MVSTPKLKQKVRIMAKKKTSLTTKILVAMGLGLAFGSVINAFLPENELIHTYFTGGLFYVGGKMFVGLLKMLVVPVVFCSLICGVVGMDDMKTLGRTGVKTLVLYLLTTGLAITLALLLAVNLGVGEGFIGEKATVEFTAKEAPAFADILVNIVSSNILSSMASGNMLQIIFACIFLGIAMANAGEAGKSVAGGIAKFNDVMMVVVDMVMALAPYGVFCLIAKTFAEQGIGMIMPMLGYFVVLVAALLIHATGTFSALLTLGGLNPVIFLKKMRSVQLFAFSTASSNATIPVTLQATEEKLGVANSTAAFTIPFGATINMDGTAIMQGVATVFVANAYGVNLGIEGYLTVIGMAVLASIGTAGVPGVGLVMLSMVFAQVGLPIEGIALIIGVDRLLDMVRTAVNVTGDAAVSCVVAKTENKLDLTVYNDPDAGVQGGEWHEHEYDPDAHKAFEKA